MDENKSWVQRNISWLKSSRRIATLMVTGTYCLIGLTVTVYCLNQGSYDTILSVIDGYDGLLGVLLGIAMYRKSGEDRE